MIKKIHNLFINNNISWLELTGTKLSFFMKTLIRSLLYIKYHILNIQVELLNLCTVACKAVAYYKRLCSSILWTTINYRRMLSTEK